MRGWPSVKEKQTVRLRDRSMCKLIRRMAAERPMGIIGMVILLVLFITAVFANQLAPYEMNQIDLLHMLDGATPAHPLGTDNLGRDILSNIIYGARISVIIGFAATAVMLLIAVLIGNQNFRHHRIRRNCRDASDRRVDRQSEFPSSSDSPQLP